MTNGDMEFKGHSSQETIQGVQAFKLVSAKCAMALGLPRVLRQRARLAAATGLLAGMLSIGAVAQPIDKAQMEHLRLSIAALSQGKVAAEDVSRTPIPGLFQVISDGEIFYVDSSGRYSVVGGSLIDMQQQRDLTAAELDRVHAIAFDRLPLQLAIKEVRGKGTRSLAVFEDPNCPICKVFTKFLDQIDDVTIYRFMYPVIAPQSEAMAQGAWCARDRATAWRDVMAGVGAQAYRANATTATTAGNAANAANPAACDTSGLAAILKFGEANRINNTPTVILGSGKRLVGATPPELFMQELEQGGRRPR